MLRLTVVLIAGLIFLTALANGQTVPENTGLKISHADAQAVLDHHNKVRKEVGSPPWQWSTELAEFAQSWADHLAKNSCKNEHRPSTGVWAQKYGENIFWGSSSEAFSPVDASESWYSEIKDFTYILVTRENYWGTGHYTQMVWKTTTQVGVGVAICPDGGIIVVANYNPPGNYLGQKPY